MANGELVREIRDLVERGDLSDMATQRLLLAAQAETLEKLNELQTEVEALRQHQRDYPSFLWLWAHRRKDTLAAIAVIVIVFSSLYIYEIRTGIIQFAIALFGG